MALRSFPVAFSHAYSQIRPFLLHAGYRQASLYSQRVMGVFLPKPLQARQQPVAAERGHHRQGQLLPAGVDLHQPGGISNMVQSLADL